MIKSNDLNRNSIITGVLLNLIMSMIFIIFIILGYRSTSDNAAIQDDTFRTHFQSRMILKAINGLNFSRADILTAMKDNNPESLNDAEDNTLSAKSNYHILLSEQEELKQSRRSTGFEKGLVELAEMYEQLFKQGKPLTNKKMLDEILNKSKSLITAMHSEESSLWVEEALKLHDYSKVKERNLHIFYGLTVCFILIQLVFIYFTIIKHQLSKKINIQHERLVLQTRLSTLGMMSAELAHEINSPLMVIDGRLRILHNELIASNQNSEKLIKNIKIIKRNSSRIQGIIKSFKTMSKSGENDELEPFYLITIFEDVNDLVSQKLIDEGIDFSIDDVGTEDFILARRIQIVQVLTNLINNSLDAVRHTINPWIKVETIVDNNKVIIKVTDSGEGIPTEHLDLIFDPFYSTKGSDTGTGLGLSISKKIMKEHGGDLIYNMACRNTQFILTFKNERARA
ncbi:MAG: HAMP domain-containing histidine kinase [Rhizobacter sp.]|nr:HAMP domain-containing histidine kinase [Bacteriovorax sp.]